MKNITFELKQHLKSSTQTLCTCWKLTRTDGQVIGFTDNSVAITVAGDTYSPTLGYEPTASSSTSDMTVDNLEVTGILGFEINAEDLKAGVYDNCRIEIFLANREAPDSGTLPIRTGTIGEVQYEQGVFKAEMRGLTQAFTQSIVEMYSQTCRVPVGHPQCGVDLSNPLWNKQIVVSSVDTSRVFSATLIDLSPLPGDGWAIKGKVKWVTGANAGLTSEIKAHTAEQVELLLPAEHPMAVGDTGEFIVGCNGLRTTCVSKFGNVINFRGFPDIPDPAIQRPGGLA